MLGFFDICTCGRALDDCCQHFAIASDHVNDDDGDFLF
jgi:hypothetical protein